jgi:hypothetical protein
VVARRKRGKLHVAAGEESVGGYEESIGSLVPKGGKGCIDLADRSGFEYLDLQPDSTGSFIHVPRFRAFPALVRHRQGRWEWLCARSCPDD